MVRLKNIGGKNMFTTTEDFLTNWGHESGSTQKILDALTDESLAQEVSPRDLDTRTDCMAYRDNTR